VELRPLTSGQKFSENTENTYTKRVWQCITDVILLELKYFAGFTENEHCSSIHLFQEADYVTRKKNK
jgi:hypothetical protein